IARIPCLGRQECLPHAPPRDALARCGATSYDDDHGRSAGPGARQRVRAISAGSALHSPTQRRPRDVTATIYQFLLFAQASAPGAGGGANDPNALLRFMLPLAGVMLLFYFMMIRPQKQKEQSLRDQVNNLKENDRVITIGGIHGVVTNVQRDAERVTVRVDE